MPAHSRRFQDLSEKQPVRYAIISDIHANLEALEAVLQEIDRLGVDQVLSLGDLVGYNANPNECVELLVQRGVPTLMGNHDAAACAIKDPVDFNPVARAAILWTRQALRPETTDFLSRLPEQRTLDETVRLVHGSLLHRDHYLLSHYDIIENVRRMQASRPEIRILFFGHTHVQVAFACKGEDLSVLPLSAFQVQDDTFYLVNPGSVGQPRDEDPRSGFLVYDEEASVIEFVRLPYDIRTCTEKILSAGLPRQLADRLRTGW